MSLESVLDQYHKQGTFEGVALVARNNRILLKRAYGLADRAWNISHRTDASFPICSLTKPFTAALVMKLVEQKTLRVEDAIASILPRYSGKPAGAVTVRQLLTHTSGLANPDTLGPDGKELTATPDSEMVWFYRTAEPDFSVAQTAANFVLTASPTATPGKFSYNNGDYMVLAALLEKKTGQPFSSLMRSQLLAPLGLNATGFLWANALLPHFPPSFAYSKKGWQKGAYVRWENYTGAGALYSTVTDLYRWTSALLSGHALRPESAGALLTADPATGFVSFGSYAYEQKIGKTACKIVERQGAIGSYRSLMVLAPDHDLHIFLLSNTDRFENDKTYRKAGLGFELLSAALA